MVEIRNWFNFVTHYMRILSIDAYNRVVNLSKEDEKEFFIQQM